MATMYEPLAASRCMAFVVIGYCALTGVISDTLQTRKWAEGVGLTDIG